MRRFQELDFVKEMLGFIVIKPFKFKILALHTLLVCREV